MVTFLTTEAAPPPDLAAGFDDRNRLAATEAGFCCCCCKLAMRAPRRCRSIGEATMDGWGGRMWQKRWVFAFAFAWEGAWERLIHRPTLGAEDESREPETRNMMIVVCQWRICPTGSLFGVGGMDMEFWRSLDFRADGIFSERRSKEGFFNVPEKTSNNKSCRTGMCNRCMDRNRTDK